MKPPCATMLPVLHLLLLGCSGRPSLGPPSPAVFDRFAPVVGSDVAPRHGAVGEAWVRAVNTWGAAVDAEAIEILEDGTPRTVAPDNHGYAVTPLATPGLHRVETDGVEVEIATYGSVFPGFGGMAWGELPPGEPRADAMKGGNGVVLPEGNTLWWTSSSGGSHVALVADGPITLVRTGRLDGDGVLDVVASTESSLFVLRGRPGGGLSWVGRLHAPNHTVATFDVGDADDDGIDDLAVVWKGQIQGDLLDAWSGDGLLGFRPGPARHLVQPTTGLTISAFSADGAQEVAVANATRNFDLFYAQDGVFQPTGPRLVLETPAEATALSPGDLDGDGLDELFFASPYAGPLGRRLQLVELGVDPRIANYDRESGGFFAFEDYTGDGQPDLLFTEDGGTLFALRADPSGAETRILGNTRGGPVAFEDPERFVVAESDAWLWHQLTTDTDAFVDLRNRVLASPGITLQGGRFAAADLTGDGRAEIVGVRQGGERTDLRVWTVSPDGPHQVGRLRLADALQDVRDIEVCGDRAFVLLSVGLHLVDVSDPAIPVPLAHLPIVARDVACHGDQAAVLAGNDVLFVDGSLATVSSETRPGVNGLWLDSDGLLTCSAQDCTVVRTAGSTFVGASQSATRDGSTIEGAGPVSIVDLDGNGFDDVVFNDDGHLTVHRRTPDGFGPPEIHRTFQPLQGALSFMDYDGDGSLDAIGVDASTGRLRVTPPLVEVIEPGDTGDTGDTGVAPHTGDTGAAANTGHTGIP